MFSLTGCDKSSTSEETRPIHWNETVDQTLYNALGEFYVNVPVFTADSYSSENVTDQGINLANIKCYTSDTSADKTYSVVLKLNEYSTAEYDDNGTYIIATKRVSSYQLVCLQIEMATSFKNGNYLNIFAYLYEDRLESWPTNQIAATIGQDIPHYDASYYQFSAQQIGDINVALVACYGDVNNVPSPLAYKAILEDNGYTIKSNSGAYYATSEASGLEIDFMFDEEYNALIIQAYILPGSSTWPSDDLEQLFSVEIPPYVESGVRYFYGLAQDQTTNALIYTIQVANASDNAEATYKATLEQNGWTQDTTYDYETWGYIYIKNKGEENECQIQFYYNQENMALIINILIANIE